MRASLTMVVALGLCGPAAADDSQFVKLLKSGRVPEARVGTILDLIASRGSTADLAYIFEQSTDPDGFSPAVRRHALAALEQAARTRKARAEGDLAPLVGLIRGGDESTRLAAIRLAGAWGLEAAIDALVEIADSDQSPRAVRKAAIDALPGIGGPMVLKALESLSAPGPTWEVRARATSALARLEIGPAAELAVAVMADAPTSADLTILLAGFLDQRGGSDRLAEAIGPAEVAADPAKMALRAMYALGRTDPALVAALSTDAGLDAETKPLDEAAMNALVTEVKADGDPARGEAVFRRKDLNCAQCHALAGAGGGVGPDLSAIGVSSPPDYIINSILLPDQAIKEQYQTLVVLTEEGQIYQGIVADRDDQKVVLKDATGALRTIPADSIEEDREGGSLMPNGLTNLITHEEFVDLVRFLSELGKEGPYKIRAVPTIQRWRVLQDIDAEALARTAPNPSTVETLILGAPEERWLPAYGLVSGDLPLAEAVAISGNPVVYLKGEIQMTVPGKVIFQVDRPDGVAAWVDGQQADPASPIEQNLTTGLHTLLFRVDTKARESGTIRAEVIRPQGEVGQFTVIGGR